MLKNENFVCGFQPIFKSQLFCLMIVMSSMTQLAASTKGKVGEVRDCRWAYRNFSST